MKCVGSPALARKFWNLLERSRKQLREKNVFFTEFRVARNSSCPSFHEGFEFPKAGVFEVPPESFEFPTKVFNVSTASFEFSKPGVFEMSLAS